VQRLFDPAVTSAALRVSERQNAIEVGISAHQNCCGAMTINQESWSSPRSWPKIIDCSRPWSARAKPRDPNASMPCWSRRQAAAHPSEKYDELAGRNPAWAGPRPEALHRIGWPMCRNSLDRGRTERTLRRPSSALRHSERQQRDGGAAPGAWPITNAATDPRQRACPRPTPGYCCSDPPWVQPPRAVEAGGVLAPSAGIYKPGCNPATIAAELGRIKPTLSKHRRRRVQSGPVGGG